MLMKMWLDFPHVVNGVNVNPYLIFMNPTLIFYRKIAATDHEPTDARKSFPCFDEPNKKATYTISITHDSAYEALSNMPVEVYSPAASVLKTFSRT